MGHIHTKSGHTSEVSTKLTTPTVLVEIAYEGGNLMPELSFGTHFFQDLVESDIFLRCNLPQQSTMSYSIERNFNKCPIRLGELLT